LKILLVQQDMGRRNKVRVIYPVGLGYLASALEKRGHRAKIFDPNIYSLAIAQIKLQEEIREFSPDAIGISIKYIDTTQRRDPFIFYNTIRPMITSIKSIEPDIKIIVGGAGFSMFAKEIMLDIPEIDLGFFLEAEDSLPALLDNPDDFRSIKGIFYRENSGVYFSGPGKPLDFTQLSEPAKNPRIINISPYLCDDYQTFGIQSKRGCPFDCSYCNYPFLNGQKIRLKDPISVVDEIESLVKNYGLRNFTFVDNIFNLPPAHAIEICQGILKRNLRLEWGAWFDLENFSEELLDITAEAGCRHFDFSPDAATDQGLRALRKNINLSMITKSLSLIKAKKNVFASYNFFCSYPGQSLLGALMTWYLLCKIIFSLFGRVRIGLGWIRIEPNTLVREIAIKEKIISEGTSLLAKNERELKKLFYRNPTFYFNDALFGVFLNIADHFLKPILKISFGLFRKKYPFYYNDDRSK